MSWDALELVGFPITLKTTLFVNMNFIHFCPLCLTEKTPFFVVDRIRSPWVCS